MKVLALHGNPQPMRQTEIVLEKYLAGLKSVYEEAEITRYNTQSMILMPCERCDACKTGRIEDCIIKDDMTLIYDVVRKADIIVFSFPIIWAHLPGKMKSFIDRFYALDLEIFKTKKRKLVILGTYTDETIEQSGYSEVLKTFEYIAKKMNLEIVSHMAIQRSSIEFSNKNETLKHVYDLGREI